MISAHVTPIQARNPANPPPPIFADTSQSSFAAAVIAEAPAITRSPATPSAVAGHTGDPDPTYR